MSVRRDPPPPAATASGVATRGGATVVGDLSRRVRDNVDTDALVTDLTELIRATLEPSTAEVWMRERA